MPPLPQHLINFSVSVAEAVLDSIDWKVRGKGIPSVIEWLELNQGTTTEEAEEVILTLLGLGIVEKIPGRFSYSNNRLIIPNRTQCSLIIDHGEQVLPFTTVYRPDCVSGRRIEFLGEQPNGEYLPVHKYWYKENWEEES